MTIELHGIELHGYHGVLDDERREGQRFLVDLELDLADTTAAETDRIEDAVDYRLVAECVQEVSDTRSFDLIESLAAAVADALVERLAVSRVRVCVRKPRPAGIAAEWSAATAERTKS